jgi:hypothetical protein
MRRNALAFACFAAALFLLDCRNPYHMDSPKGSIAISFSAGPAKTLVPNFTTAVNRYEVHASKSGSPTQVLATPSGGSVAFENLDTGTWNFSVTAMDANGTTIGTGSAVFAVASGTNQTKKIPITFIGYDSSSTGNLAITLIWPKEIDFVDIAITPNETLVESSQSVGAGTRQMNIIGSNLPLGPHTLKLTFKRGGAGGVVAGVFVEAINLFPGLTTDSWIDGSGAVKNSWTFNAPDFLDASTSLSGITIAGAGFSFDPSITTYYLYPFNADSVSFTPSSLVDGQYITYSWNLGPTLALANNATPAPLEFESGINPNVLIITVTAPDRSTQKTYDLHIQIYNVIYDANGGSGDPPAIIVSRPAGRSVTLSGAGSMAKAGYGFGGWNTAPDGSGTHYDEGAPYTIPAADSTFYAQWANTSVVSALGSIKAGGTPFLSGEMTASDLSLLKEAILAATAPVNIIMSAVTLVPANSLPANAFSDCAMLESINLPSSLNSIGAECFSGCTGLTPFLNIPNSVTSIGDAFVSGCATLQEIDIGSGVSGVSDNTFAGPLPALEYIMVNTANTALMDDSGVLYDKAQLVLLKYPSNRPGAGYTTLSMLNAATNSFQACVNLKTLVLPTTLRQILDNTFDWSAYTIKFMGSSPPLDVGSAAFNPVSANLHFLVPAGSAALYETALGFDSSYFTEYP